MHVPERIVAVITNCCRESIRSLVPLYSPALGAMLLISMIGIPTFNVNSCGGMPDGLREFKNSSGNTQAFISSDELVESALLYVFEIPGCFLSWCHLFSVHFYFVE
mmetsp:Transcript_12367/g.23176  ORF Transcript_12367/g.23176 Transcript_12367/m.23176 type:complete len:106 (-) Transcript_12367:204-521(-)